MLYSNCAVSHQLLWLWRLGVYTTGVPQGKAQDVYNAFSGVVSPEVPKYLMSAVKADDAKAAYSALMEFKDVVKAAR